MPLAPLALARARAASENAAPASRHDDQLHRPTTRQHANMLLLNMERPLQVLNPVTDFPLRRPKSATPQVSLIGK